MTYVSFGPYGKSKLLCNSIGGNTITKDSLQLINHYFPASQTKLIQHLLKLCYKHAASVGDGLLTIHIVLSVLFAFFESNIHITLNNFSSCQTRRLYSLRAIDTIAHVMKLQQSFIISYMTKNGTWCIKDNVKEWINDVCMNILVPSCDLETALKIVAIMDEWLLPERKYIKSDMSLLGARCRCILEHMQSLLFPSIGTYNTTNRMRNRTSTYHTIPDTEMVLQGRCKNYNSLSQSSRLNKHQHHQREQQQDENNECSTNCRFVCIQYLLAAAAQTSDYSDIDNNCSSTAYTISVVSPMPKDSGDDDNRNVDVSYVQQSGIHTFKIAVTYLQQSGVEVVFCNDKINDEAIFVATTHGVSVIDSVSVFDLSYLSAKSNCKLLYNTFEWIAHYTSSTAQSSDTTLSSESNVGSNTTLLFGYFSHVNRLKFTQDSSGGGGSMSYFQIVGLHPRDVNDYVNDSDTAQSQCSSHDMPQIIVPHDSTIQCGVFNRLIRRCLTSISFNCTAAVENEQSFKTAVATTEQYDQLNSECVGSKITSYSLLTVPGGGAVELGWAMLWKHIAGSLHTMIETSNYDRNAECISHDQEQQQRRHNRLVSVLAANITSQYERIHSADVRRSHLMACIQMCECLSSAYTEVPKRLLQSCADVIDVEDMQIIATNSGYSSNNSNKRRSEIGHSLRFDNAWRLWTHVCESSCVQDNRCTVGIIANIDPYSFDICRLGDTATEGICFSYTQFWAGFMHILDSCRLYLRTGGNDESILHVTKLNLKVTIYDDDENYWS